MLWNYIKIALRNFQRQRFYALINIIGLTIGLTTSLLIILYLIDEFSYDTFHMDAKNIYRVQLIGKIGDQEMNSCYTSAPVASGLVREIPEIEDGCRIALWNDFVFRHDEDAYSEKKVLLADSNFFEFFNFKLLHGNPETVLKEPNNIVLTEFTARKYFGAEADNPAQLIGSFLNGAKNSDTYIITGIAKDPPSNSHVKFNLILSMESWPYSRNDRWGSNNLQSYIKLNDKADWHAVENKFPLLVKKYIGPVVQQMLGISIEEFFKQGGKYGYYLQPLLRIHLYPITDNQLEPPGNIKTVYLLSAIVVLIIIIACINFMNLSTAQYSKRAKEVGLRKSFGASRKRLFWQFLMEPVLITSVSMALAILLLFLVLPRFNMLAGKMLAFDHLITPTFLIGIMLNILIVGFLAGSYPAMYLTSFTPIEVMRSKISAGMKSGKLRSYFVVFQFTISIGLIISTLLIFKQLKHLQQKDLGFDKENILVIKHTDVLEHRKITFKEELQKQDGILNVSITNLAPPDMNYSDIFKPLGQNSQEFGSNYCLVDYDYLNTMGMEMASGRFFSDLFPSDSNAVIINETTARLLGWENPVGEKIQTFWADDGTDIREVIGVVKDYHFQPLNEEINTQLIFPATWGNLMLVRLAPGDVTEKIKQIESQWKAFTSGQPFEFSFVDADFDAKFRKEQQMGRIFLLFTTLAIFVACLGLIGLATFMSEQRSKEMGIRKVMGASNSGLVLLLSKEYLKLVTISFIIAVPLAYLIVQWWLKNFAYKIDIGAVPFITGGLIALFVALLSVSYQSLKAAIKNPSETLRYE